MQLSDLGSPLRGRVVVLAIHLDDGRENAAQQWERRDEAYELPLDHSAAE